MSDEPNQKVNEINRLKIEPPPFRLELRESA
jgi:hypothetical protein